MPASAARTSAHAVPPRTHTGALGGLLAILALVTAAWLGNRARLWNDTLAIAPPPVVQARLALADPSTPRLARRVLLFVIDGLGADEADLPFLAELRQRGADATARVAYPTISRPSYVTILSGSPPSDSGVRANRVRAAVAVDTIMDRVRAAGGRVGAASDLGVMVSLFMRVAGAPAPSIVGIDWQVAGTTISPPPPLTWPIDDARRVDAIEALAPAIRDVLAGDPAFTVVLVLDVDRAGHASGVGADYRAAARAADAMIRDASAGLDLARDTLIVTADHGHVAPGGHGGVEREISHVPLVLAGAGIVPGTHARDARLIDVAPTVAALLGVPAPREAAGRALIELLALPPPAAARRAAIDVARGQAARAAAEAARTAQRTPAPARLAGLAIGLAVALAIARWATRRGALRIPRGALAGTIALAGMAIAIVVLTRGRLSPSYVPSLGRTIQLGGIAAAISIVVQVVASQRVIRRAARPGATGNGVALVGLTVALGLVGAVRAWFSPPFFALPPPVWLVVVPTLDLAAATCALATAITLALAARRAHASPPATDLRDSPTRERAGSPR